VTLQCGSACLTQCHSCALCCADRSEGRAQPQSTHDLSTIRSDDYSRLAAARVTAADVPTQIRLGVRRGLSGVLYVCRSNNGHVRLR
jgi:hypothetical protein